MMTLDELIQRETRKEIDRYLFEIDADRIMRRGAWCDVPVDVAGIVKWALEEKK